MSHPPSSRHGVLLASMAAGLLVCYAFGTAWFMTVYARETGPVGLATALGWCVVPFILPDAIKIAVAFAVCLRLKGALRPAE